MEQLTPPTASDATGTLRYVSSLVGPWRWLIGIACLLAVGLTLVFYSPGNVPAWTGKTIVRIGLVPGLDYLLQDSGSPLEPVESNRSLVSRVSDPIFRIKVMGAAKFEPANAVVSKKLASSSLRAVALEGYRDVSIEVSAASSADVNSVLQAVADEIIRTHDAIIQRRIERLRANLTDLQSRIGFIEKSFTELGPRMLGVTRDGADQAGAQATAPNLTGAAEFWSKLRDRAQRTANLLELTEKTVIYVDPDSYQLSKRTIAPIRAALVAGLAMLAAMIILVVVVSPHRRHSS